MRKAEGQEDISRLRQWVLLKDQAGTSMAAERALATGCFVYQLSQVVASGLPGSKLRFRLQRGCNYREATVPQRVLEREGFTKPHNAYKALALFSEANDSKQFPTCIHTYT